MKIGDKVRVRAEIKTIAPKDEDGVVQEINKDVDPQYPFYVYFSKDNTYWAFAEDELEVL